MNIELKPIAESKVRQLGGDVCGVLVRTEDSEVMAVSEHGRCTRLDAGVMGPVDGAQGGQGAEVVAWCWENHGRHVTVDKSFAKELIADGEIVRPLVYGDTQPKPAVPEGWSVRRSGDRVTVQHPPIGGYCASKDGEDQSAIAPVILYHLASALLSTPTTPQADGWMLAETHRGMRISAEGVLGRVRGQLKFGAQEMLKHLEAMSEAFYSGNVKAVDQFLQTWDLDEKRPQPPAGQEGA